MYFPQWRVRGEAPRPPTTPPCGRGGGGPGEGGGRDNKEGGEFARNLGRTISISKQADDTLLDHGQLQCHNR